MIIALFIIVFIYSRRTILYSISWRVIETICQRCMRMADTNEMIYNQFFLIRSCDEKTKEEEEEVGEKTETKRTKVACHQSPYLATQWLLIA